MVLGLALLACALPALAEETVDLPAQEARIWAPVGDLVGQDNHGAVGFQSKDPHGNEAKGAEDWQLVQKYSGSLLLGWFNTNDSGKKYWFRGYGDNAGTGGLVGKFDLGGNSPGKYHWNIDYRNFDYFYDRTSEMRTPSFAAPPPPPELDSLPGLNWRRGSLALSYHPSDVFTIRAGYNRKCREGDKGSLLRGGKNETPPRIKTYDTTSDEVWGGIGFATGSFGSDLTVSYLGAKGDRSLEGRHDYTDDQTRLKGKLGLSYALSGNFKLLGTGSTAKIENTGREMTSQTYDLNGETKTTAGRLGLLARFGKSTDFSASANFQTLDTDAQTNVGADVEQATDRKRESQEYRVGLGFNGLAKTLLRLDYRFGTSNLDETVVQGLDSQIIDRKKTRNDLTFRGKYRFSRAASLKASVAWKKQEVEDKDPATTGSVNPWLYWLGDNDRDQLKWELALRTRPWKTVRFDIGHQAIDQTYTRKGEDQSETTWQANRGFANLNWFPMDILTIYGTFSYGTEKYGLTGDPVPTTAMAPIAYDGTTMRFTPGATLMLGRKLDLEGYYEGVRFEDKGNEDVIKTLQADHDRVVVRAGYQAMSNGRLTLSYTRNEFDENRWDDYIHHLYAASISGTF
jgi:hypothetical protein